MGFLLAIAYDVNMGSCKWHKIEHTEFLMKINYMLPKYKELSETEGKSWNQSSLSNIRECVAPRMHIIGVMVSQATRQWISVV